ncbi:MAG: PAS domain S-box protein [Chlorobi bacterium]|nr:PAS domain S-box protein [Chlorobiota bacterium]
MVKILAIDDQSDNLMSIKGFVKTYLPDCKLFLAASGKEGISIATKELPDTILLDILMPGMDGFEVCKALKENKKTRYIPVIMLSALGSETANRVKSMDCGADAVLAKPFKPLELKATIKVMLRIKEAEDNLRKEKASLEETVLEQTIKIREEEQKYRSMFENMLNGFAYHEIVCDDKGKPIDYIFREINRGFERLTGLKRENLIGKRVTEALPGIEDDPANWIDIFGKVARTGKDIRFDNYSVQLKRWYHVYAYRPRKGFFVAVFDDITERKQVEQALKNSEEQSKAITRTANDAIITINQHGLVTSWNDAAERIFGYPRKDMINNGLSVLIPDKYLEGHNLGIKRLKDGGKASLLGNTIEITAIKKNGSEFPIELSLSTWEIDENKYYTAIIRDISKRKESEKELIKLSTVVEQSANSIVMTDKYGTIEYVNPKFMELTQYSKEETIGKNPRILKSGAQSVDFYKDFWNTITSGQVWRGEFRNRKKNGDLYWENATVAPIVDLEGNIVNYIKFVEDITEKKRTEYMQKALFNIANALIKTDNLESLIRFIHKELNTIIDATNFYIALYDEKTDTFSLPFMADENDDIRSFPAGKTLTAFVLRTRKSLLATSDYQKQLAKEGKIEFTGSRSKVWLGVPLENEGVINGVLAVQSYTDEAAYNEMDMELLEFVSHQISISIHRKKIFEELTKALKKAKESDRLKSAFLQNISHEVRTPMNGILGFTSLLKEVELSKEERQEYIDIITVSGTRMLNTLKDIVDISMLETGQVNIEASTFAINDEFKKIYELMREDAAAKGLNLRLHKLKGDIKIYTDQEKLHSILRNIIDNAIKYSNKGNIDFGCTINESHAEFYITDEGKGIPIERQEAIFEPFVQADTKEVKAHEGSGLGLSIAKAYVEMLDGHIRLSSKENIGTQVYFTIPIEANKHGKTGGYQGLGATSNQLAKKLKILIAEDDPVSFDFLSVVIEDISKDVLWAKDGKEAVRLALENKDIDLILMDIKMPLMDGLEATRAIRKFNGTIKIIAQTAFALSGDDIKALSAGCDAYITKPTSKSKLLETINKMFR